LASLTKSFENGCTQIFNYLPTTMKSLSTLPVVAVSSCQKTIIDNYRALSGRVRLLTDSYSAESSRGIQEWAVRNGIYFPNSYSCHLNCNHRMSWKL
jgi:hypothetical protein